MRAWNTQYLQSVTVVFFIRLIQHGGGNVFMCRQLRSQFKTSHPKQGETNMMSWNSREYDGDGTTQHLKTGSGITLDYCGYSVFNLATFLLNLAASYLKLERVGNTVEKSWLNIHKGCEHSNQISWQFWPVVAKTTRNIRVLMDGPTEINENSIFSVSFWQKQKVRNKKCIQHSC